MNTVRNKPNNTTVLIYGDGNEVSFGSNVKPDKLSIYIGTPDAKANNCIVTIGNNCTFGYNCMIRIMEDGTVVKIGDDCMLSNDIQMWASDTHTIIDSTGNITNIGKYVTIGNHVWVGINSTILKNTTIPNNCIIGACSVVHGDKYKNGDVICGNPSTAIKHNMNWSRERPNNYIKGI